MFGERSKKRLYILGVVLIMALFCAFQPSSASFTTMEGVASWYSEFSPGVKPTTANMEIFDHRKMTCAMWDVPFNTMVEVTNLDNGKKIIVRVNDRGPAKRLVKKGRIIDLTMRAFDEIADLENGLARVRVKVVR